MAISTAPQTAEAVRAIADARHAAYPQYARHWDGPEWVFVTIRKRLVTKAGLAFEAGDRTLMRWHAPSRDGRDVSGYWVAYSWRNGIDTAIARRHIAERPMKGMR